MRPGVDRVARCDIEPGEGAFRAWSQTACGGSSGSTAGIAEALLLVQILPHQLCDLGQSFNRGCFAAHACHVSVNGYRERKVLWLETS